MFEAGQVAGFVAVQVVEVFEVAEFAGWPVESLPVVVEEFVVEQAVVSQFVVLLSAELLLVVVASLWLVASQAVVFPMVE